MNLNVRLKVFIGFMRDLIVDTPLGLEASKALLFLSSEYGEGVTTSVLAAGRQLSDQLNRKVLYIDTTYEKPDLHRQFDVKASPGVSDYLVDKDMSVTDCVHEITPTSYLIPIGKQPGILVNQMNSNRFGELINTVKSNFDCVLVDTCPLTNSLPTKVMLQYFENVVLVLACGRTRWESAQHLKEIVEANKSKIAGVILNKRKFYIPKWLYRKI